MKMLVLAAMVGVALFAAAVRPGAASVHANGVPQLVKLTYLAGVSNFGPKDAEGVVEFSFAEAYARLEVKNLKPQPGYGYEAWLTGGGGQPVAVGPVEVDSTGAGAMEAKLEGLERYDYNLFVIAARPAEDATRALPTRIALGGRFTVLSDADGDFVGGDVRPAQLPDTGEPEPGPPWGRIVTTTAVMAGAALILFGIIRTARRRRAS